jgi:hypothetical protein
VRSTPAGAPHRNATKEVASWLRSRVKQGCLLLGGSGEFDGFPALDIENGLHGVCEALDQLEGSKPSLDQFADLNMAVKILSSILQDRVELQERELVRPETLRPPARGAAFSGIFERPLSKRRIVLPSNLSAAAPARAPAAEELRP